MAECVGYAVPKRWPEFSHEQQLDLNAYQNSLLNRAHDLQALTVRPAFASATDVTESIERATREAQDSLTHIRSLTVALNVGAITVALASYVARANVRGIQTALRELDNLLVTEE